MSEPRRRRHPFEPGYMATAPRVYELEGAIKGPPVPPGFEQQQLPGGLPLIQVVEATGAWTQGGEYGRINRFAYPARLNDSPIAVFSKDRQPGPPRPRTLHFFRNDSEVGDGVTPVNVDLYALVTYGVGSVQNSFFCDWSRGGQISLVCDAIRVEAVPYVQDAASPYLPPPGVQLLGCLLSHEGSAPPKPPTFTTPIVLIDNTEAAVFAVPDFARWVYPMSVDPIIAGVTVSFGNQQSFVTKNLVLTEQLSQLGTPVPGGVNTVEFVNNSGNAAIVGLQFELGL